MPLKQEAMILHYAVDPLVVRVLALLGHSAAAQDGMHPAIAVGGQVGDDGLDLGKKRVGWGGRTPDPLPRAVIHLPDEVRAGNPENVGHGLHREPA
jgi:hypothetical protein